MAAYLSRTVRSRCIDYIEHLEKANFGKSFQKNQKTLHNGGYDSGTVRYPCTIRRTRKARIAPYIRLRES